MAYRASRSNLWEGGGIHSISFSMVDQMFTKILRYCDFLAYSVLFINKCVFDWLQLAYVDLIILCCLLKFSHLLEL